jgi:hypothetical protein
MGEYISWILQRLRDLEAARRRMRGESASPDPFRDTSTQRGERYRGFRSASRTPGKSRRSSSDVLALPDSAHRGSLPERPTAKLTGPVGVHKPTVPPPLASAAKAPAKESTGKASQGDAPKSKPHYGEVPAGMPSQNKPHYGEVPAGMPSQNKSHYGEVPTGKPPQSKLAESKTRSGTISAAKPPTSKLLGIPQRILPKRKTGVAPASPVKPLSEDLAKDESGLSVVSTERRRIEPRREEVMLRPPAPHTTMAHAPVTIAEVHAMGGPAAGAHLQEIVFETPKLGVQGDGRYIPYAGGSLGWFENTGVSKIEQPAKYQLFTALDGERVREAQLVRSGRKARKAPTADDKSGEETTAD